MTIPDGFVRIDVRDRTNFRLNLGASLNELSAFTNLSAVESVSDEIVVDRNYGLAYTEMKLLPAAIYGAAEDLPCYSGDSLANDGFLRVPFRRIPRRIVRNRKELEEIVGGIRSGDKQLRILFRGQTKEHLIKRNVETSRWLYGADSVLEPSLATSASRRSPSLEAVMPEWCALLRMFIDQHRLPIEAGFMTDGSFRLYALALAQHYGLPTSGIDVTDRLEVALFFALMKFNKAKDGPEATYAPREISTDLPVIYVLAPAENQQFDYERFHREGFPPGRPFAQSAFFMHIGWGHAENQCASRIFLALYLDPDGDFGPIPSAKALFPTGPDDLLDGYLAEMTKRKLSGALGKVLAEGFYSVLA